MNFSVYNTVTRADASGILQPQPKIYLTRLSYKARVLIVIPSQNLYKCPYQLRLPNSFDVDIYLVITGVGVG